MTERDYNIDALRMALAHSGKGFHEIRTLIQGQRLRDQLDAAADLDGIKAVVHALITNLYGDHEWLRKPPPRYDGPLKVGMTFDLDTYLETPRKMKIAELPVEGGAIYGFRITQGCGKGQIEYLDEKLLRATIWPIDDEEIPF